MSQKSVQWEPSSSKRPDGQTDRHDTANSHHLQFWKCVYNVVCFLLGNSPASELSIMCLKNVLQQQQQPADIALYSLRSTGAMSPADTTYWSDVTFNMDLAPAAKRYAIPDLRGTSSSWICRHKHQRAQSPQNWRTCSLLSSTCQSRPFLSALKILLVWNERKMKI